MPSTFSRLIRIALTTSLSIATLSTAFASDATKLSKEKQEELNKLLAEAVKQAGIELEDEELTIVIVKKPGKDTDSSESDEEVTVIADTTSDGASEIQTTEETAHQQDKELATKVQNLPEEQPSSAGQIEISDNASMQKASDDLAKTPQQSTVEDKQDESNETVVTAPISDNQAITEAQPESSEEIINASTEHQKQPVVATSNTTEPDKVRAIAQEASSQDKPLTSESEQQPMPAAPITAQHTTQENTATVQSNSSSTENSYSLPKSEVAPPPSLNDEYYGKYIPPQNRMDTYYSSDIMEAINAKGGIPRDIEIPIAQASSLNLSMMASDEMSDLVVEGALDATAAGGVSTTTLKTAVVVPDAGEIEDLDKGPEEDDAEELKEALNKRDLNKRVKDALELLSHSRNRGNSTGTASAGTLTATNVNVTATISSRQTNNALSTHRSNLRNSNF